MYVATPLNAIRTFKALTWSDVDVERGIISVRRSFDRESGELKQTKIGNKGIRRFAIEQNLKPLLRAMHAASSADQSVIELRNVTHQ